jgi:CheY-like chemotaxis protein
VEDSKPDLFLIREAIEGIDAEIQVVMDGAEALNFLTRVEADLGSACPDLVILDINLPKKKGGEILRSLRSGLRCGRTQVIVVTSSSSSRDRDEMSRLGANGYFHKPSNYADFMKLGDLVRLTLENK